MPTQRPLLERKQQRTRQALVDAAFDLFVERGFDRVTVTDIADRAETGRTTFFRYFGDKQEVLFADEETLIEDLTARLRHGPSTDSAPSLADALGQLRTVIIALCHNVTEDRSRYQIYERLLGEHVELNNRSMEKLQHFTDVSREILLEQGFGDLISDLAPQLALACYLVGRRQARHDPDALVAAVTDAFDELLTLHQRTTK
jgi:AcrR family transcriptional regulator